MTTHCRTCHCKPRRPQPAIHQAAALILRRAGYRPEQIADSIGATAPAKPSDVTRADLEAAAAYLRDAHFTYYGVTDTITTLRGELPPAPPPSEHAEPDTGQLDLFAGAA
jgi:hypothetical protein